MHTYKYLGCDFHATKSPAHGISKLAEKAHKAMYAINRRCVHMHISDPILQCGLFDTLVLPILSYASEVWAVNENLGKIAGKAYIHAFSSAYLALECSQLMQLSLLSLGIFRCSCIGGNKSYAIMAVLLSSLHRVYSNVLFKFSNIAKVPFLELPTQAVAFCRFGC